VLAEGQQRSSLTVEQSDGRWAAVGFGSPSYARLLVAARERLGCDDERPSTACFELRVPALNVSFVARQHGEELVLMPVLDDPRFDFDPGEAVSLDRALEALAPLAREHNGLPT